MKHPRHAAFSLVELSIVLVILGLLVGGILAGQSLIRAAELRSLGADVTKYTTATFAFKDKYFGLPGDITNATSFWGIAGGSTGNDVTCQDTSATDARTCNGDGNGQLDAGNEPYRYWQQLSNAGLIDGQFTGKGSGSGSGQNGCTIGRTCPRLRLDAATLKAIYSVGVISSVNLLAYSGNNYFFLGKTSLTNGTTNDNPLGAILSTEEAWNLDTKLDDGKPYNGTIQTHYRKGATATWAQDVNNCALTTTQDSDYDLARPGLSCAFRILLAKP